MQNTRHTPVIFVSSTCYDLRQIRADLKEYFEENYGFQAMLSEYDSFPIDPCKGTFENCIQNVDNSADIFILIVGNRYGYVTDSGKSITNLEYLHAKAKGIPIFVFVDKQLYDHMKIWRSNKDADFSAVVDNPQLFEFVSGIYDESKQWIYTYDSVRDIKMALKQQLSILFFDGLVLKKAVGTSYGKLINSNISSEAIRVLIEKPYAWEHKFLAYALKNEFDLLQTHRWDYKYGFYSTHSVQLSQKQLLENISEKIAEISGLTKILETLLNSALQDAIGEPGVPSNLDMMVYVSKQIASIYKRLGEWGLYFKTLRTDEIFDHLLQLLYELPSSVMKKVDDFVDQVYEEITNIPDIDDGVHRHISVTCVLDAANTEELTEEIERLVLQIA